MVINRGGDAEIRQHRHALRIDEHVAGLDVSMDDALAMCGKQGARQIDAEIEHLVGIERGLAQSVPIAAAGCEFEYGVAEPVAGHAGFENRKDVGV